MLTRQEIRNYGYNGRWAVKPLQKFISYNLPFGEYLAIPSPTGKEAEYLLNEWARAAISPDTYQEEAARTREVTPPKLTPDEVQLLRVAVGLTGEAGEVADKIKKLVYHKREVSKDELVRELGDVLWYIAEGCTVLGTTLSEVMYVNIKKLKARYPDGWEPTRSGVKDGEAR